MTRVEFHVHDSAGLEGLALTACRLAEEAFQQAQRVYIHTDSEGLARQLDERLWTFHDTSFIPHALAGRGDGLPVIIGHGASPAGPFDLLINIAVQVPDFYAQCGRVVELVDGDPQRRAEARDRFRFYREHGLQPETHKR
jgi:DNA polymerase-3 subunit chi